MDNDVRVMFTTSASGYTTAKENADNYLPQTFVYVIVSIFANLRVSQCLCFAFDGILQYIIDLSDSIIGSVQGYLLQII